MSDCIFCQIAAGEISATIVHRDEDCVAFRDINPQAPIHIVAIPIAHVASLNELSAETDRVVGRLLRVCAGIAAAEGIAESGYRIVANCGEGAGQSVPHLHFHLLGGRSLGWPPG